ncbi:lasso peptide biosynthesis B2 protein [Chloroflexota bacterium]
MFRQKLNSARRLSLADWGLLLRAWIWLLLVDLGLRVFSFARFQRLFVGPSVIKSAYDTLATKAVIQRTWRLVDIASRYHLYKMSYLRRSLVLQRLLSRQGLKTELRFGVTKEDGILQAHAWLEFEGLPVGEPETLTERYTTLLMRDQA